MRFLLALLGSLCGIVSALAQDSTSVRLQPVVVRGFAPERFMAGLKVQHADTALLQAYRFQNLADLLALQAPVNFKSYGPGQLTTVGFRGTSANHTALLWNGVNINQPTLGQTDFATIPIAGFDRLLIQYGSAASTIGTDAVGGSILLNSVPVWDKKLEASVGYRRNAYGTYQLQANGRFVAKLSPTWQLAAKTSLLGGELMNRPAYSQRRGYPVETAQANQRGLVQDLYFRNNKQDQLSFHIWLNDNKAAVSPDDTVSREITRTQAYRFMVVYERGQTAVRAGFIRDITDYGKGTAFEVSPSHSETDRFLIRPEREFSYRFANPQRVVTLKAGAEWVHYNARVDGYGGRLLQEDRADLYALFRYQHNTRLHASVNIRQAFVTRYDPPLAPSLGLEYTLLQQAAWKLVARANVARSYRVPTLNERYWKTLGNPEIKPESGFSREAGLSWQRTPSARLNASLNVSVYRNLVDNWTYWNPDRGYRVENLQQVLARGAELQGTVSWRSGCWQVGGLGQYAYTRSTQQKAYDTYSADVIGKQLVYVPLHTASASLYVRRSRYRLTMLWQGSDRRAYTFDNSRFLAPYQLVNLLAETSVNVGAWRGRAVVQVDNLFNEFYLNVKRNVMPGRTVALTLVFTVYSRSNSL